MVGISLRSFKSYENDEAKKNTIKYAYIVERLEAVNPIDEEHGLLTIDDIRTKCQEVLSEYQVEYCILFGSYAKGTATPQSDVDILISGDVKGLKYYDMIEKIRNTLKKRVDVLDLNQLKDNLELTNEILRDGVRIYG